MVCFFNYQRAYAQTIPTVNLDASSVQISDWLLVGPFSNDDLPSLQNIKNKSNELSKEFIEELAVIQEVTEFPPPRALRKASVRDAASIDVKGALGLPILENLTGYSSFAFFRAYAEEESDLYIVVGHQEAVEIYVNGECLGKCEPYRYRVPAGVLVHGKLKSGENLIWIRVIHGTRMSFLGVRFEKDFSRASEYAEQNTLLYFKDTHIAFDGPPLEVTIKGWRRNSITSLELIDFLGKSMEKLPVNSTGVMHWSAKTGLIAPGLYSVQTVAGDGNVANSECFCVGDPDEIYKQLQQRETALSNELRADLNLRAIHRRWKALTTDQTILRADLNWRRKIIYTLEEYTRLFDLLESGRKDFASTPGLHILGFRSKIDDQPQYYRLFVPSVAGRHEIPLVVILPTVGEAERPFIESAFVANQIGAEDQSAVAE